MAKKRHEPFRPKARQHPSGRPVVRGALKSYPTPRFPHDEPLTPGLRRPDPAQAIGFTVDFLPGYDPEDDDD